MAARQPASLRSEHDEIESAVEMTPRGKRGKLQKAKPSFPLFPPGLEIRPKTKAPDFHISTAPTTGLYQQQRTKHEAQTRFQLTDAGHFTHHTNASVASLRP
jgi:hypothetical protein